MGPSRRPTGRFITGPYLVHEDESIEFVDITNMGDTVVHRAHKLLREFRGEDAFLDKIPNVFAKDGASRCSRLDREAMQAYYHAVSVLQATGQLSKLVRVEQYVEEMSKTIKSSRSTPYDLPPKDNEDGELLKQTDVS